MHTFVSRS